jgi:hypothetical protein
MRKNPFDNKSSTRTNLLLIGSLAVLAGCGGQYQAPVASPAAFVNTSGGFGNRSLPAYRQSRQRSWMSPDAAKSALLYVSDYVGNTVKVYSYPGLKLMGTLTDDLGWPDGMCVDKKQNVWVVNNNGGTDIAVEFKHGGKNHIAAVQDAGLGAHIGCAVDPTTGNLAVTTYGLGSYGGGLVSVYAHAKGAPEHYSDSNIPHFNFCGYDPKGNLYADGTNAGQTEFHFAELAKGATTFADITFKGGAIDYPGGVQWDGKYVAVGDQAGESGFVSSIYQTTGAGGKIVSKTPLDDTADGSAEDIVQFWIDGKIVVGPNADGGDAGIYKYPAGGKPTQTLKKFDQPQGAVISQ